MKLKNKIIAGLTTVLLFTVGVGVASAGPVAGGKLYFNGGQTGTYVYSEIYDNDWSFSEGKIINDDGYRYEVKASVKVCGSVTTSGWLPDYARITEDRKWYCNETAHYDYRQAK